MSGSWTGPLEKIDEYRWLIPKSFQDGMRVPGLIYTTEQLIKDLRMDQTPVQVANVACLPGILKYSMAMPDIHWGYGFPIGGVAACGLKDGVISPGGVGYDINCGVRLMRTDLCADEIENKMEELLNKLFNNIPSGLGTKGKIRLSNKELREVLVKGSAWAVKKGYGWPEDIELTEGNGCLPGADPDKVSERAMERGRPQSGTLGSGNHFLEVQEVVEIYNPEIADVFGLRKGQVMVMMHSGSRGLGYQVCDDYLKVMGRAVSKYNFSLPDRQLACAPINSPEGKDYFSAMAAAANYAWANRQWLMHWTREVFSDVFAASPEKLGMSLVYDVTHNIAKFEDHEIEGKIQKVCVHRKGATRSFCPGHPDLPEKYKISGQPVIIPGDMGRNSYVMVGTKKAMEETFGSTCHGAGRLMSRTSAMKAASGKQIYDELSNRNILVRTGNIRTLSEEAPAAYKNVNEIVDIVHGAGLSLKVAKLRPLGVIKG
ncbi:MAG: RtcB family protein [bacterium]|nr:RtcB family protein [bacterium]